MSFIQIENVFFSYDSEDEGQPVRNAVDGVTLSIEKAIAGQRQGVCGRR